MSNTTLGRLWLSRNLLGRSGLASRRRTIGKVVLLVLVTTLLVVAQLFVSSMIGGIIDKYALLSNGHLQVFTSRVPDATELDQIAQVPQVIDVQRVIEGGALAYSDSQTSMVVVKGVDDSYFNEQRLEQVTLDLAPNAYSTTRRQVLLSKNLAESLQVSPGDNIALMIVPDGTSVQAVRPVLLQVAGTFSSGYKELDESLCFIGIEYASELFPSYASSHVEIVVSPSAAEELPAMAKAIDSILQMNHVVRIWYDAQPTLYANLMISQQMVMGVFIIVALLAGFFIMSMAVEFIQDDKAPIATLKLLGCTTGHIKRMYMALASSITAISLAAGLGLGLLVGLNMGPLLRLLSSLDIAVLSWYLLDFKIVVPWASLGILFGILLVVSLLSVLFSLRRINKISPMELLR